MHRNSYLHEHRRNFTIYLHIMHERVMENFWTTIDTLIYHMRNYATCLLFEKYTVHAQIERDQIGCGGKKMYGV